MDQRSEAEVFTRQMLYRTVDRANRAEAEVRKLKSEVLAMKKSKPSKRKLWWILDSIFNPEPTPMVVIKDDP